MNLRFKSFLSLVLIVVLRLLSASWVQADAFEIRETSAREAAMGGNLAGAATGGNIVFCNPALLGDLQLPEISATRHDLMGLGLLYQDTLSLVYPLPRRFGLGVAYNRLSTNSLGFFDYQEHSIIFSSGLQITDYLNFGAAAKFYYVDYILTASGMGSDFALNYKPDPAVNIALVLNNGLQTKLTWDTTQVDTLPGKITLAMGNKWLNGQLVTNLAVNRSLDYLDNIKASEEFQVHGGVEVNLFSDLLALRGGAYSIAGHWQGTFGLALHVGGFNFAYAFLPHYELGNANVFSLGLDL